MNGDTYHCPKCQLGSFLFHVNGCWLCAACGHPEEVPRSKPAAEPEKAPEDRPFPTSRRFVV